ncbi:MAG: alginate lyase family protein [Verrucomicrobia bacterium]|nr:alginate lyase family protein [Verrucomicrobiota bacterium]
MKNKIVASILFIVFPLVVLSAEKADSPALARLYREADKALKATPGSVMEKAQLPPSRDKHDYLSLAPYWWPDPAKPDGLPWIRRDGEVNPNRGGTDSEAFGRMCSHVETLGLAYRFSKKPAYAEKAATILKVWFLDAATKMNPNLDYAQGIPGRNTGRGAGIIDTVRLIRVAEAVTFLDGAPSWTPELKRGMQDWFRAYLQWLLTSKNGLAEAKAPNNHGVWYLAQTAAYALFVGDADCARKSAELGRERIGKQIEPDGRQPQELQRTKSYGYTIFCLDAFFTLAELGRQAGVDLFAYRTADGRSIRAALDYVAPYFSADKKWPGKQIKDIHQPDPSLGALLRRAAIAYHEPKYEAQLQTADLKAERFQLLWPRP